MDRRKADLQLQLINLMYRVEAARLPKRSLEQFRRRTLSILDGVEAELRAGPDGDERRRLLDRVDETRRMVGQASGAPTQEEIDDPI